MKHIVVRYDSNCTKCSLRLSVGSTAMYERNTGLFCVGCQPTEPDDIRFYRTQHANRKAHRYDAWATQREDAAYAQLNSHADLRHDWAFVTQPGHISFRDRMNRADERAFASLKLAETHARQSARFTQRPCRWRC